MEIPALPYDRTVGTHVRSVSREREDRRKRRSGCKGKAVHRKRSRDAERKKVAKYARYVPRKAAIVHMVPVP